jgi:DNA-binding transcriptional MerR regulator
MSNRDVSTLQENNQSAVITYSTKELAGRLGISVRTLYNHRMNGLLNFSQSCDKAPVLFTLQDEIDYKNNIRRINSRK